MLVSVIIPVFNCQDFIEQTIYSVLNQSYTKLEIIVIDDKSTDETETIVKNLINKDNRIKYIQLEKNYGGPARARNVGIEKSNGSFIAFLDSDDIWKYNKIEECLKYSSNDIIHHYEAFFIKNIKNISKISKPKYSKKHIYKELLKNNLFSPSSILVKKNILLKHKFNESEQFNGVEDYDLWVRIFKEERISIKLIKKDLTYYRLHSEGLSKNYKKHGRKERKLIKYMFREFKFYRSPAMFFLKYFKIYKSLISNFYNIYRFNNKIDIMFLFKEILKL